MSETSEEIGKTKVLLFGLGSVGSAVAELCSIRPWITLSGAVVNSPRKHESTDLRIIASSDVEAALDEINPDIALVATRPTISEVLPAIEQCASRGVPVICTSEELALPAVAAGRDGTERIEELAQHHGVAIAATGINPGFVFDALPLAIAGAAWEIDRLYISRSLDASVFGREVHKSLGVGYDEEGFKRARDQGVIYGHIGFEESASIIASTMGLVIDDFEDKVEPVFTDQPIPLRDYQIEPGETAGVNQRAVARTGEDQWLEFDLSLHVAPDLVGMSTRDRILVEGTNTIDVTIEPGTQAVLTTSARLVNAIAPVLSSGPGLYNAVDLLPAAPWLGPQPPVQAKSR